MRNATYSLLASILKPYSELTTLTRVLTLTITLTLITLPLPLPLPLSLTLTLTNPHPNSTPNPKPSPQIAFRADQMGVSIRISSGSTGTSDGGTVCDQALRFEGMWVCGYEDLA